MPFERAVKLNQGHQFVIHKQASKCHVLWRELRPCVHPVIFPPSYHAEIMPQAYGEHKAKVVDCAALWMKAASA